MSAASVEQQLISGWFEAEDAPGGSYRWSSARAAAVVRLEHEAREVRMRFRLTPGRSGPLGVSLTPVASSEPSCTWEIPWQPGDWREETFPASLQPGDYRVDFDVAPTWSNVGQSDRELPPENRTLGFALAALSFA